VDGYDDRRETDEWAVYYFVWGRRRNYPSIRAGPMSHRDILGALTAFFEREGMDYAVIGAFALFSYGYVRATRDMDFVTRRAYRERTVAFLESLGFETTFCSDAFSNHVHPLGAARVDMMYVEEETAREIFGEARRRMVFEGHEVPVASAEHLVAMKLFAISNDPERAYRDFGDIRELLRRADLDRSRVKEYFGKYGQADRYDEICGFEER
jgi:hypothetical protein